MAWSVVSYSKRQALHFTSSRIFLFFRVSLVGRALEHTFQRKILILFGMSSFQIRLQKPDWCDESELDVALELASSHNFWYPTFTVYSLLWLSGQMRWSLCSVHHNGIALIRFASKLKKCWCNRLTFQVWVFGSMSAATWTPSNVGPCGETTLAANCPRTYLYSFHLLFFTSYPSKSPSLPWEYSTTQKNHWLPMLQKWTH